MNREQMEEMLDAYIECALWAETGSSIEDIDADTDKNWLELGYTRSDLEPSTLGYLSRDIERFVASLTEYESKQVSSSGPRLFGRHIWFTKQGHGVSFDDVFIPSVAELLNDKAHKLGECWLYLTDDNKIGLAQ